jgi:Outer membrane lipoprotein carrier protein LolA
MRRGALATAGLLAVALLLLYLAAPAAFAAPANTDPWQALERLRGALASSGPLAADFSQSYVPAGFEAGDVERGTIAVSMPDCLRWDYREPFAKSFLVCGARAWSWVEGEPRGQRTTIDAEREMGLDLLLLSSASLADRYRATIAATPEGGSELTFEPLDPKSELVAATLVVASGGERPLALDWRDREGNVTSFRFDGWRAPSEPTPFAPPSELEWSDPSAPEGVR